MAKIKVIAQYTDKHSGLSVGVGEVLEVSEDRAKEIIGKGKAIEVKEEKAPSETKELKAKVKTKN